MAGLFGSSSSSPAAAAPAQDMQAKKEQIMQQIQGELQLANAQELINKMNEKCFAKCVPKPGAMLTSAEETCTIQCMDHYMAAFNIVSKQYVARLTKERSQGGQLGDVPM